MDVIEIDGASNRGIDEIRNLREAVKFSPSKGPYKIYIIDEVHMLTMEAFNALLKTLEEPPTHVKFIFATTQPHKIPATILSRCQRFDFRRIPSKDIILKLREVAKEEKIDIEEEVFLYIAKSSDGSMRDAESILDQVASFSKGKVHAKDVVASLGMIGEETIFHCADLIIDRNTPPAIHLINEILSSGKDGKGFLSEILEHFRNLMIAKVGAASEQLIDLPMETIERIKKQSQSLSKGDIFYIIDIITNSLRMMAKLLPERIVLELSMIRLTSRDSISSIEEILSKLPEISESHSKSRSIPAEPAKSEPSLQPGPAKPEVNLQKLASKEKETFNTSNKDLDITRIKDAWPILVKAMAVKKMSVSAYLAEGEPDSVKGNTVYIAFPKELNFHREVLEERHNRDSIEPELSHILDAPVKLQFIATDRKLKEKETPAPDPSISKEQLKKKEPIINTALNIFGGKVLKARNT